MKFRFRATTSRIGIAIVLAVITAFVFIGMERQQFAAAKSIAPLSSTLNLAEAIKRIEKVIDNAEELRLALLSAAGQPAEAIGVQSAAVKPALRSPRQIDRPPIADEKVQALVDIAGLIEDKEVQTVVIALLKSKRSGNFLKSLRDQTTEWLLQSPEDRSFDSPLSPKQLAWAGYLVKLEGYGNPKNTRPDLYPRD